MSEHALILVDDEPGILDAVEAQLAPLGHPILRCRDGVECLETLKQGHRGLILMDVKMPRLDGWQTLQAMVAADLLEGNLVCMVTAIADPSPAVEPLKEYVADYVTKPFDDLRLLEVVTSLWPLLPQP